MTISKTILEDCLTLYTYLLNVEIPITCRAITTKDNVYHVYFYDKQDKQYANFDLKNKCAIYVIDYYLKECKLPSLKEITFNV